ncbi:hypothetical protein LTR37_003528 [Vermiconidia calcicola]|uniref:Uncharacterized protein n=1 Tax=Vermiconidia calcicola TaxID=1690605 RepID=A0ACC3NQ27_9PEZI|nr:hypothetical protein LTR37_003528 [Vermiconidia calcicola]
MDTLNELKVPFRPRQVVPQTPSTPNDKSGGAHAAMAREAVFSTYELLEGIMLAVPTEDIILAANVCTKWRALIESSISILNKLHESQRRSKACYDIAKIGQEIVSPSCFILHKFDWGTVFIRRLGGVEFFAVILQDDTSTSLRFPDEKTTAVGFQRRSKTAWWMEYEDREAGIHHIGEVLSIAGHGPMHSYLMHFYSAEGWRPPAVPVPPARISKTLGSVRGVRDAVEVLRMQQQYPKHHDDFQRFPSNSVRPAHPIKTCLALTEGKATQAVFETYELIEYIILALPTEDILLAASVSKACCHVIERSFAIRQKLLALTCRQERRDYLEGSKTMDSHFVCSHQWWGALLIRRLNGAEEIAIVPNTGIGGLASKVTFPVGGTESVRFRYDGRGVWSVMLQYSNVTLPSVVGPFNKQHHFALYTYLEDFH